MPVSEGILTEISSLYYGFKNSADVADYLFKNRKEIRIISDSLWEQSVENIFGVKPKNYLHAMQIINKNKHEISDQEDIAVVNALHEVLLEYDVIIDKRYIDISKSLLPLFVGDLKRLCIALASHSAHLERLPAAKLLKILRRV
ncbi:hypothetical protein D4A39_08275 [Alcanivorax profundi]|uniref:Uncharacterized protein n=1 Tax=Alcanivorax profundi TaxID=2338368 RepID=A0A418XZK0_9GAMM|nr:hypothetical protein [Alcanivorax profundi]RJG18454.1 hypothetical protein D4A39_08275 [Alcanivorax profundi]